MIWSTLEDTRKWVPLDDDRMPTLMGKYKVPHFDAKGEADQGFTERGVPTTFLVTSFYWDNLIYFGMGPKPGPDGVLAITMPMGEAKLPGIAAADIGGCAYGIFRRGHELVGETVGIAGHPTGAEMAAALTAALGREVRYNDVPPEVHRSFDFPGADDLGNMFQFKRDFNAYFCGAPPLDGARALNPQPAPGRACPEVGKEARQEPRAEKGEDPAQGELAPGRVDLEARRGDKPHQGHGGVHPVHRSQPEAQEEDRRDDPDAMPELETAGAERSRHGLTWALLVSHHWPLARLPPRVGVTPVRAAVAPVPGAGVGALVAHPVALNGGGGVGLRGSLGFGPLHRWLLLRLGGMVPQKLRVPPAELLSNVVDRAWDQAA